MNSMRAIFAKGPPVQRMGLAAALALPSALIGANIPGTLDLPWFPQLPFLPGILFGIVVVVIVGLSVRPPRLQLAVLFLAVVIAWLCAYNAAVEFEPLMSRWTAAITNSPRPQVTSRVLYSGIPMGVLAGMIGSAITALGVSFAAPSFRSLGHWARTVLIGMLAGTLLEFALSSTQSLGITALFVVWQSAIAASIAASLHPDAG